MHSHPTVAFLSAVVLVSALCWWIEREVPRTERSRCMTATVRESSIGGVEETHRSACPLRAERLMAQTPHGRSFVYRRGASWFVVRGEQLHAQLERGGTFRIHYNLRTAPVFDSTILPRSE